MYEEWVLQVVRIMSPGLILLSYLVKWFGVRHYPPNITKQLENGPANHRDRKSDKLPRPYRLHQKQYQREAEEGSEKAIRR